MQRQVLSPRVRSPRSITGLLLFLLFLSSLASTSQAQSGRRPPKQPKSPDPFPQKQQEPPVEQSSEQNSKSQIPVKVVWYSQDITSSSIYTRIVQEACLERLSQSRAVKASAASEMNRKQASDSAKGSSDTYVLWFELQVDATSSDRIGYVPPQYLYVRYEVFTPGTGKTKTSGHVYQRPRGPGGVPLPVPPPNTPAGAEYSLRYAGREVADRLLDTLGLPPPADRH